MYYGVLTFNVLLFFFGLAELRMHLLSLAFHSQLPPIRFILDSVLPFAVLNCLGGSGPRSPDFGMGCLPIILARLSSPSRSAQGMGGLRIIWHSAASYITLHLSLFNIFMNNSADKGKRGSVSLKLLGDVCDVGTYSELRKC